MCPYPKRLTGGGAYLSLSLGELYLTKIRIDLWSAPNGAVGSWSGGVAAETDWSGAPWRCGARLVSEVLRHLRFLISSQ
jgi:hypothetical protein